MNQLSVELFSTLFRDMVSGWRSGRPRLACMSRAHTFSAVCIIKMLQNCNKSSDKLRWYVCVWIFIESSFYCALLRCPMFRTEQNQKEKKNNKFVHIVFVADKLETFIIYAVRTKYLYCKHLVLNHFSFDFPTKAHWLSKIYNFFVLHGLLQKYWNNAHLCAFLDIVSMLYSNTCKNLHIFSLNVANEWEWV